MHNLTAVTLSLALALPVSADPLLSEVTGNWAGASNQGFHFRAQLTRNVDKARLTIWGGAVDGVRFGHRRPRFRQ